LRLRTSPVHLTTDARQCASERCTFRRRIMISSAAHPSNRRNSMKARGLSFTSIVTFWF
jgi:hypothetical protein